MYYYGVLTHKKQSTGKYHVPDNWILLLSWRGHYV